MASTLELKSSETHQSLLYRGQATWLHPRNQIAHLFLHEMPSLTSGWSYEGEEHTSCTDVSPLPTHTFPSRAKKQLLHCAAQYSISHSAHFNQRKDAVWSEHMASWWICFREGGSELEGGGLLSGHELNDAKRGDWISLLKTKWCFCKYSKGSRLELKVDKLKIMKHKVFPLLWANIVTSSDLHLTLGVRFCFNLLWSVRCKTQGFTSLDPWPHLRETVREVVSRPFQ